MQSQLIAGYIELKEGSSVRRQFADTFNGNEGFDEQNVNALKYILDHCKTILSDSPFIDNSDLNEYIENLEDYLK